MATSALAKDREKNAKKVDKALKKLIKEWEEMYGGYVRKLRTQRRDPDS